MKNKLFTHAISIFTTPEMYIEIRRASYFLNVSLSELMRDLIQYYLDTHKRPYLDLNDGQPKTNYDYPRKVYPEGSYDE